MVELPGCFASGATLDELTEALHEAVVLWLDEKDRPPGALAVAELKLAPRA